MIQNQPVACLFFDVDGTLIPGTSSGVYLASYFGHAEAMTEAEEAYAQGTLSNSDVCSVDASGWRGFRVETVEEWLNELPLIGGIEEILAWCHTNAVAPILTTLAWTAVGKYLAERFGFLAWCGPELEVECARYTGRIKKHFDEFDKCDFALTQARLLALDSTRCAAIGDSRSDLPLFDQVDLSIALNGTPAAQKAATVSINSRDLRAVIDILERWRLTRLRTEYRQ